MKMSALRLAALAAMFALVPACAAKPTDDAPPSSATPDSQPDSLLAGSNPANGATLSRSPANLTLSFSRPARLHEVLVTGPDGMQMPVMVTAAAETGHYSLPLPELEPGRYAVAWRAESAGQTHRGTIRFTIR